MNTSNWPGGIDYSHPNHTLKTPRVSRYDGQGAWEKDSSTPPFGWPLAIALGIALCSLILFGPMLGARLFGA